MTAGVRRGAVEPKRTEHGQIEHNQIEHGQIEGRDAESGGIAIRLDELLAERGMTLTELSERVGITVVNLSVLKNGRARAIRFSTLGGLCAVLGCQPGDLLRYEPGSGLGSESGSG